jgi:hypothetical protein
MKTKDKIAQIICAISALSLFVALVAGIIALNTKSEINEIFGIISTYGLGIFPLPAFLLQISIAAGVYGPGIDRKELKEPWVWVLYLLVFPFCIIISILVFNTLFHFIPAHYTVIRDSLRYIPDTGQVWSWVLKVYAVLLGIGLFWRICRNLYRIVIKNKLTLA